MAILAILIVAGTLGTAISQPRRIGMLLAGIGISGIQLAAWFIGAFYIGPGKVLHNPWIGWILILPLFAGIGYIAIALGPQTARFRRGLLVAAVLIAAGLYFLDSLIRVEFSDQYGHPVQDGVVEIVHSSYWWGSTGPPYPRSDENGSAYVGLVRAWMIGKDTHMLIKGDVVNVAWPKKAIIRSR